MVASSPSVAAVAAAVSGVSSSSTPQDHKIGLSQSSGGSVGSVHRAHSQSELKFLVAAEMKTDETPLSASKCPMGKFT